MTKQSPDNELFIIKKSFIIKKFLSFFLIPMVLFIIIILAIYQSEKRNYMRMTGLEQSLIVQSRKDTVNTIFKSFFSDILILSEINYNHGYFTNPDVDARRHLQDTFLIFSKERDIYDQLRVIDASGFEMLRVNNNADGNSIVVPYEELQNKSDRYYFTTTIAMKPGEVFVSPLDLNIEKNETESSMKAMIRLGKPVHDLNGVPQGIVILNYLADNLLEHFEQEKDQLYHTMLVNSDGYWLRGMKPEDEWGFMFENRKDRSFAHDFQTEWVRIKDEEQGQFYNENGMFTFTIVKPLYENPKLRKICPNNQDYCWTIVSYIPADTLNAGTARHRFTFTLLTMTLALLLVVSSISFALSSARKKVAEEALKFAANKDSLTGLSNRREFSSLFENERNRYGRNRRDFSLVLSDIDHFKKVNDAHGHDCGDAILKQVANILQSSLRQQDIIGRWGGEEFIILLPETNLENGRLAMEKVREIIEETTFTYGKLKLSITMSFGVSLYNERLNLDVLAKQSDESLYKAKELGRNRVIASL